LNFTIDRFSKYFGANRIILSLNLILGRVCDLDVGLGFPFGAEATQERLFIF